MFRRHCDIGVICHVFDAIFGAGAGTATSSSALDFIQPRPACALVRCPGQGSTTRKRFGTFTILPSKGTADAIHSSGDEGHTEFGFIDIPEPSRGGQQCLSVVKIVVVN